MKRLIIAWSLVMLVIAVLLVGDGVWEAVFLRDTSDSNTVAKNQEASERAQREASARAQREPSNTPEPSSLVLLTAAGSALLGYGWWRRRKRA